MKTAEIKQIMKKHWDKAGYDIDTSTCNGCYPNSDDEVKCKCAFDLYNFDGDCLAEK